MAEHGPGARQARGRGGVRLAPAAYDRWFDTRWGRYAFTIELAAVERAAGRLDGLRVLDAGCGVGRHLLPLVQAGFRVWGVDADPKVLQLLQARLNKLSAAHAFPGLVRADLNRLPFASGSFDLVVSINVINHGYAATFREYCRELDLVL